VPVDGDRHGLEAGIGDELAVVAEARVLDGQAPGPARPQRAAHERKPLGEAAADLELVGRRHDRADAAQVAGERRPEGHIAPRIRIRERRGGQLADGRAVVAQPDRAREARRVGEPAEEPRADVGPAVRRGVAEPVVRLRRAHPRSRALTRLEVALGRKLAVGVDDDAAGDAEVARQDPRGRKRRPDREAAAAHGAPELALELLAQAASRGPIQGDEQLRRKGHVIGPLVIGLLCCHRIGPCQGPNRA
jgi:hypothetical protein